MKLQSPLIIGVLLLAGLIGLNQRATHIDAISEMEHAATPQWKVAISLNPSTVLLENLDLAVNVQSSRSGYLTLLQRGTDGTDSVVFPNALDQDNHIEADVPVILPRPHWKLRAAPPAGSGRVLAIVTDKPLNIESVQQSLSSGRHIELAVQSYGAASANYLERE